MTTINEISVVIPHFGDPAPTMALVSELQHQDGDLSLQIIVSDDASPEPFPERDGYTLVRRRRNGGFGAAVNSGIARAVHGALIVLNSDVTIPTTFLRDLAERAAPWWPAIVAPAVQERGYEICVGRRWPTASQHLFESLDPLARWHGRKLLNKRIGLEIEAWHRTEPLPVDWVVGVCMLLPTQSVRAIGGFDERFYMNCEEVDLQRRLHYQLGLPVIALGAPTISHTGGGSSESAYRLGWITDARFRYHDKWAGVRYLYYGSLAVSMINLGWNLLRQIAGRDVDACSRYHAQREAARCARAAL